MFILKDSEINAYNNLSVKPNRFPDGTLALGSLYNGYDEIMWLYDGDEELFTLMCLRQHTKKKNIKLILPYIPHARMDRTEDGEVFTLKTFCSAINSMNFDRVVVADPHSNVSVALLDRVKVIKPINYIQETIRKITREDREILINFYPDEGAMKRYSKMFPYQPYAYGNKDRDWKTGKINGLSIINSEMVKERNVLIVDDICSRGGTFYHSAKALKAAGAKEIYLYITHCEDTMLEGEMYNEGLVKKIFTTDSLLKIHDDDKVKTIYSFAKEFMNGKVF